MLAITLATLVAAPPVHANASPAPWSGSPQLVEVSKLLPSTPLTGGEMGQVVAIDGQRIAVGSPFSPTGGLTNSGALEVYELVYGTWISVAELPPTPPIGFSNYGAALALRGERIAVGAPNEIGPGGVTGAVYVFERDPVTGTWPEVQRLAPDLPRTTFGASLALDGDRLLVGATTGAAGDRRLAGVVLVFERDVSGTWKLQAALASPAPILQGAFGFDLDLEGDRAAISELNQDAGSVVDAGVLHVFERDRAGDWGWVQALGASTPVFQQRLGWELDLSGDTLVASSQKTQSAHVFRRDPFAGLWFEEAVLTSPSGSSSFGTALGLSGDLLVVGAPFDGPGGRAYAFERSAGGVWTLHDVEEPPDGDRFGDSVAVSPAHAVIGNPFDDELGIEVGAAFVYDH